MSVLYASSRVIACDIGVVWAVLCDPVGYAEWYGPRGISEFERVEPSFSAGGRLRFRNNPKSIVITDLRRREQLVLSSGEGTDEFRLTDRGEGRCEVAMKRAFHADVEGAANPCKAILEKLEWRCYDVESAGVDAAKDGDAESLVGAVLKGYRSPARKYRLSRLRSEGEGVSSDNTEQDVSVSPRSAAVCVALGILLFAVLNFTFTFQRSDVVPSTGLSVMESGDVNRVNAERIYIGQGKNDLELMLSCRGLRLSTSDYYYCSTAKDDAGRALQQIYIRYDAYGRVRGVAYLDITACGRTLDLIFWDIEQYLNADMSNATVENLVERSLSAFRLERSGKRTIFFGRLKEDSDLFSDTLRSELVISLDPESRAARAGFYLAFDRLSALPESETELLTRQYRSFSRYLEDRDSFERVDLLFGRSRFELDVVLGGGDYETDEDGVLRGSYRVPLSDGSVCRYEAVFNGDGRAESITYVNGYLEQLSGTLVASESYDIYRGMSLADVYRALQVIPVSAHRTADMLTLYFGDLREGEDGVEATIVITADLSTRSVIEISYS